MSFTDVTLVDTKSTDIPQTLPLSDEMFEMLFASDDEMVETPPKTKKSKLEVKCVAQGIEIQNLKDERDFRAAA